jgi:hypothetical protein
MINTDRTPPAEIPCPKCGCEGPHTADIEDGKIIAECGDCYHEFDITAYIVGGGEVST